MENNWAGWKAKNVEHAICRMLEFHGDKPSERMAEILEIIIDDRFKRTDLAQSLADALEGILDSVAECESGDVCQKSDFSDARAALANYRKGE